MHAYKNRRTLQLPSKYPRSLPVSLVLACDSLYTCVQVSRTDANVLFELNPQDMEVIKQMNYSAVLPEVKVMIMTLTAISHGHDS